LIFLALIIPISARAGIFSLVANILTGSQPEIRSQSETIQNMALLEATGTGNPNAGNGQVDTQIVDNSSFLAESGPLGSAADMASTSLVTSDQISVYTVRSGDTLSGIGNMFNVTINTILWANNLKRGALVHEGDTLVILPISGVQYTVKKGDTLASIAKKYGGDKGEIMVFNNLDSEKLTVGQTIVIPDGEATVPSQTKQVIVNQGGKKIVVTQDSRPNYVGYYQRPISGGRKSQGLHGNNGIDIAAPAGTPILASASGVVILVREGGYNGGYGNYAVIKHPNGTQTLYAHASYLLVTMGQAVAQGQVIGGVGSTGRSTGSHLHFEIRGARNPF
jgi:LysM repeat protein